MHYHESFINGSLADPQVGDAWRLRSEHALDGHVQLGVVHLLASDIEVHPVLLHQERNVLPVTRGQFRFLDGHHLLFVFRGEHDVQRIGFAIGDYLEQGAGAVTLLHGEQGAPGAPRLLEVGQEQEAALRLHRVHQVSERALGHRRDQFRVQDLVGWTVGVVALHGHDPVVLLRHLNELEQVVNAVVVSAF